MNARRAAVCTLCVFLLVSTTARSAPPDEEISGRHTFLESFRVFETRALERDRCLAERQSLEEAFEARSRLVMGVHRSGTNGAGLFSPGRHAEALDELRSLGEKIQKTLERLAHLEAEIDDRARALLDLSNALIHQVIQRVRAGRMNQGAAVLIAKELLSVRSSLRGARRSRSLLTQVPPLPERPLKSKSVLARAYLQRIEERLKLLEREIRDLKEEMTIESEFGLLRGTTEVGFPDRNAGIESSVQTLARLVDLRDRTYQQLRQARVAAGRARP